MKRQKVSVKVFSGEQYDGSWPPTKPVEFMAWFQQWIDEIPPEFRDAATMEIESIGSYEDSHYAKITIAYTRPETDDEYRQRIASDADEARRRAEANAKAERATYERLKKKFGGTTE